MYDGTVSRWAGIAQRLRRTLGRRPAAGGGRSTQCSYMAGLRSDGRPGKSTARRVGPVT